MQYAIYMQNIGCTARLLYGRISEHLMNSNMCNLSGTSKHFVDLNQGNINLFQMITIAERKPSQGDDWQML